MTTKVASSPTMEAASITPAETERTTEKQENGMYGKNRHAINGGSLPGRAYSVKRQSKNKRQVQPRPPLPTFPLEVGYREVYAPTTGRYQQQPLTLLDILYPKEEDIDVVVIAQGPLHDRWCRWLANTLQSYLRTED